MVAAIGEEIVSHGMEVVVEATGEMAEDLEITEVDSATMAEDLETMVVETGEITVTAAAMEMVVAAVSAVVQ